MNFSAELLEDELAAAATEWIMSVASRVLGSISRSVVKVLAIQPVAVVVSKSPIRLSWLRTHDTPFHFLWCRHRGGY